MRDRERHNRQARKYRQRNYNGQGYSHLMQTFERIEVPPEVLADRERRAALVPLNPTAALCGDPHPSRRAPSTISQERIDCRASGHRGHYLDSLVFGR